MPAHNAIQLTGQRFGYLTALRRAGRVTQGKKRNALWLCRCDCGEEVLVGTDKLRTGVRKSCFRNGHHWTGWIEQRGLFRRGQWKSERSSFERMHQRCDNPKHQKYYLYGARGVTICERWSSFKNFVADMGPKPTPQHTIDRHPDPNGNYEPGNCRWATRAEQARNKRNSVFIEYEGQRMLLVEVVEKLGLSRQIVYGRLKNGWTLDAALTAPVKKTKPHGPHRRKR